MSKERQTAEKGAVRQAVVDALLTDDVLRLWRDEIVQADIERVADRVLAAVASARGELSPEDPRHGLNGYGNLGCRCGTCREANSRAVADRRAARKQALAADPTIAEHGVASTYQNYRCRCAPCTTAATAARNRGKRAVPPGTPTSERDA